MIALPARAVLLAAAAALLAPAAALAVDPLTPYARLSYYYDSNVFALAPPQTGLPPAYIPPVSDHTFEALAGLDINEKFGRQEFSGTAEGRHFSYDRLTYLDRYEHLLGAGLKWHAGNILKGKLSYSDELRMAPFVDRYSTVLTLQHDKNALANLELAVTPEWAIRPEVTERNSTAPLPDYPSLKLREVTESVAILYSGFGLTRVGLKAEHLSDVYSGVETTPVPDVTQKSLSLIAEYEISKLSSFEGSLGYTSRQESLSYGNFSGWTGSILYKRELTPKTSIKVGLKRSYESYLTSAGTQQDTGGSVDLEWKATYKLSAAFGAFYTQTDFLGYSLPGYDNTGRGDRYGGAKLVLRYDILSWLSIQPHVAYQKRDSSTVQYAFDETIVGIDLYARPGGR